MSTNDITLKVSTDNGATFTPAPNGVKVVYENVDVEMNGKPASGELHVTLTQEGIVQDLWGSDAAPLDTVLGTSQTDIPAIVVQLMELEEEEEE